MFRKANNAFLTYAPKTVMDVWFNNSALLSAADPHTRGVKGIMWSASRSKPVREPEELVLVDGIEHHDLGARLLCLPGRRSPVAVVASRPPLVRTSGRRVADDTLLVGLIRADLRAAALGPSRSPPMSRHPPPGRPCASARGTPGGLRRLKRDAEARRTSPSSFASRRSVCGSAPGSHVPGPVSRVCFAAPRFPRFPAFTPPPVFQLCSSASSPVYRRQTCPGRAAPASRYHDRVPGHRSPARAGREP